jgi:hypothetical protein
MTNRHENWRRRAGGQKIDRPPSTLRCPSCQCLLHPTYRDQSGQVRYYECVACSRVVSRAQLIEIVRRQAAALRDARRILNAAWL